MTNTHKPSKSDHCLIVSVDPTGLVQTKVLTTWNGDDERWLDILDQHGASVLFRREVQTDVNGYPMWEVQR